MYGVPENLDLTSLVGDCLGSINIQENQVTFLFDRGVSFVVEGRMEITFKGNVIARWEQEKG
jgi:hypothetical protein